MLPTRLATSVLVAAAVGIAACGQDDRADAEPVAATRTATATSTTTTASAPAAVKRKPRGAKLTFQTSPFGDIVWGPKHRAVYAFELDGPRKSACFGECAALWPPVYTKGRPRAGRGLDPDLIGSIKRGKRRQVTYAGRPLYYYVHEGPGEVRCHNVNLNGGLWWVIDADGKPRP